jgi:hypothetical protein
MELRKQSEVSESLKSEPREVLPILLINSRIVELAKIAKSELETLAARFEVVQMHKFGRAIIRRSFIRMNPEKISTIPEKLPFMDEELEEVYLAIVKVNDRFEVYHPFARSAQTG